MRLRDVFREDPRMLVLVEATLTRLGLAEEAAMPRTDEAHKVNGAVVACDKGLVECAVESPGALRVVVHAWRDVSAPLLTATTEVELETLLERVHVRLTRPPIDLGTADFDLGTVEWQMASTDAAVEFWSACLERAGAAS